MEQSNPSHQTSKLPRSFQRSNKESKTATNQLYYATKSRRGQVLHTRLRLNHSDLNEHLYRINLAEQPTCDCGAETESVKHYLLECPTYHEQRQELLNSLQDQPQIEVDTLLNGSPELSIISNVAIFKEVQNYILKTKRFEK
jgi:hypothetical protein